MAEPLVNLLLQTFPSLDLPATLCIPLPRSATLQDAHKAILSHLPLASESNYILTTPSNRPLLSASNAANSIDSLDASNDASFISVRLSLPLVGGKGGFGSQLRAAGGRMSSKRRRDQAENSGSNRNLDGRRLRTVTEAKALAEYLAVKPEMEKKEREAKRKRWEQIVEMAEEKSREIKSGSKGRVNGEWVENKEEASERTREATRRAMGEGTWTDQKFEKRESSESNSASTGEEQEASSDGTTPPEAETTKTNATGKGKQKAVEYFGFDEEDEFMSDEEGEEDMNEVKE